MRDDGTAMSVMLGMAGFRVLTVSEQAGEVEQAVETTAGDGWCPAWGYGRGCMIGGRAGCGIFPPRVGR